MIQLAGLPNEGTYLWPVYSLLFVKGFSISVLSVLSRS